MVSKPKVALIHDYLKEYGGAEKVLEALCEIYPEAPIYTSFLTKDFLKKAPQFREKTIIQGNFARIPLISTLFKGFSFLLPLTFEGIDLRKYDLVISTTTIWAKGVITGPAQVHISYIHTPPRFLYHYPREVNPGILAPLLAPLNTYLRIWDFESAQRPDILVSNSKNVAERINKFYRRDSRVIYPPVELPPFESVTKKDYFLIVSRLVRYKNLETVIRACTDRHLELIVVGTGSEEGRLKSEAGPSVKFLGFQSREKLISLMSEAKAVIYPVSDEDFGIVPVEAMSVGTPVIGLNSGGLRETIIPAKTGILMEDLTIGSYAKAFEEIENSKWDREDIRKHAEKFSKDRFKEKFHKLIESELERMKFQTKNLKFEISNSE